MIAAVRACVRASARPLARLSVRLSVLSCVCVCHVHGVAYVVRWDLQAGIKPTASSYQVWVPSYPTHVCMACLCVRMPVCVYACLSCIQACMYCVSMKCVCVCAMYVECMACFWMRHDYLSFRCRQSAIELCCRTGQYSAVQHLLRTFAQQGSTSCTRTCVHM